MVRKTINTTVDEETIAAIERLSREGRFASKGQVIDAGVAALVDIEKAELPQKAYERAGRIEIMVEEILDLVRSVPEPVVPLSEPSNPIAISGVGRGVQNLPGQPVRETSSQRAERERRERQQRARSLDSVDDFSIDRGDDYVSG